MKNQDLNSFKPLNEEEEKHVVGGQPGGNQCGQILLQIQNVEAQIQSAQQGGNPPPPGLIQQLSALKLQYQLCMNQQLPSGLPG